MTKSTQPTVLATFRIAENVLTHIADNTYRMNSKLAQNSDLSSIASQVVNLLTFYLDKYYMHHNITVRFDNIINTKDGTSVPLKTLILAESESSQVISDDMSKTLCAITKKFIQDVQNGSDDLFTKNNPEKVDIFTSEQSDLIDEHISNFIKKCDGKTITKPFVCVVHGTEDTLVKIQGAFKSPVTKPSDNKKGVEIFFTHSDGSRGSDLLVFLKRVEDTNKILSGSSKEYIAEKYSHTQIAAAAFVSGNPLVKVVSYDEIDAKGKTISYIKDIFQASAEDLGEFELELTE